MIELVAGTTTAIAHLDDDGLVPSVATVELRDPQGSSVESPVVTLPSASTTVQIGSTVDTLQLASVAGIVAGRRYVVRWDGTDNVVRVADVDGSAVRLRAALYVVPDVGASFRDPRMTATLASIDSSKVGGGWQIEWRYNNGTDSRVVTREAAVVRWPWRRALSAADVAEIVATAFRSPRSIDFCSMIADRVDLQLRTAVQNTGRRPHLYLDPGAFREVAHLGAMLALADVGMTHNGDPVETARQYRYRFNDELGRVIASLTAYADSDGRTDPANARNVVSIQGVR